MPKILSIIATIVIAAKGINLFKTLLTSSLFIISYESKTTGTITVYNENSADTAYTIKANTI